MHRLTIALYGSQYFCIMLCLQNKDWTRAVMWILYQVVNCGWNRWVRRMLVCCRWRVREREWVGFLLTTSHYLAMLLLRYRLPSLLWVFEVQWLHRVVTVWLCNCSIVLTLHACSGHWPYIELHLVVRIFHLWHWESVMLAADWPGCIWLS